MKTNKAAFVWSKIKNASVFKTYLNSSGPKTYWHRYSCIDLVTKGHADRLLHSDMADQPPRTHSQPHILYSYYLLHSQQGSLEDML